jgi:hypothetical protein
LATPGIVKQGLKWMLNPQSPFYVKPRIDLSLIKWGLKFIKMATDENVEKIFKEHASKEVELETIKSTTINHFWTSELDSLREEYLTYKEERQRLMIGEETKKKKNISKEKITINKKTKLIVDDKN